MTILNRLYSPQEDLTTNEIKQSMMSWVPRDQTTITVQQDIYDMAKALEDRNIPISVSFSRVI